jgi:Zn ribbon nucleic-acid-binding protein
MGSIIDYIHCPNCGEQCYDEYYYKTGEQYTNCNHCGYHKSVTIKDRSKKMSELTEDDYEMVELSNPFGAYRIMEKGSFAFLCGSLVDEDELKEFIKKVNENKSNIESASYSRLVDNKILSIDLITKDPE